MSEPRSDLQRRLLEMAEWFDKECFADDAQTCRDAASALAWASSFGFETTVGRALKAKFH